MRIEISPAPARFPHFLEARVQPVRHGCGVLGGQGLLSRRSLLCVLRLLPLGAETQ